MVLWISLSICLPLLPLALGILIATLLQVEVALFDLLNGIELLLISLGLITATGFDFYGAPFGWSGRILLYFFVRFMLVLLGIANIVLLTLVYVEDKVPNLRFDSGTKFTLVFLLAGAVSLFTVVLQLHIGCIRY